jgi:hypothetical protein
MITKKPRVADEFIKKVLVSFGRGDTYDSIQKLISNRLTISKIYKWYNSLTWEEAKFYAAENEGILKARSDYLEKKALDSQLKELKSYSSHRLEKHFDEMAEMAGNFVNFQQMLGIDRINQMMGAPEMPIKSKLKYLPTGDSFWAHFHQEFPELDRMPFSPITFPDEMLPAQVLDRLRCLAHTAQFSICSRYHQKVWK